MIQRFLKGKKKKTDIEELFMYYFGKSRFHCPVDEKLLDF